MIGIKKGYGLGSSLSAAMAYAVLNSQAQTAQEKKLVEETFFGPSPTDLLLKQFDHVLEEGGISAGQAYTIASNKKIHQASAFGQSVKDSPMYKHQLQRSLRNTQRGAHVNPFSSMYGNYYASEGESMFAAYPVPGHPLPEWAMRVAVNLIENREHLRKFELARQYKLSDFESSQFRQTGKSLMTAELLEGVLNVHAYVSRFKSGIQAVVELYRAPIFVVGAELPKRPIFTYEDGTPVHFANSPGEWLDFMISAQRATEQKDFKLYPHQLDLIKSMTKDTK